MSQINLNHTTPAAPAGNSNVTWQADSSNNISGYVPNATVPLTTKGDILGYDTAADRIPVGSDGKVLTADSGAALGVSWQTPGGGSGVLGTAIFDASGGSIGSPVYAGNISGVSYTSTGIYVVTLTGSPSNYLVTGIVSNDSGTFIGIMNVVYNSVGTSGFTVTVHQLNGGGFTVRDFPVNYIAVLKI